MQDISEICKRIGGYWECYHYGFSQIPDTEDTNPKLNLLLLHVDEVHNGDILCKYTTLNPQGEVFSYNGRAIPKYEQLYIIAEDSYELSCDVIDLRPGNPDTLYGVTVGVSGYGEQGRAHTPSAARFALRRLGQLPNTGEQEERKWNIIRHRCIKKLPVFSTPDQMRNALERTIGGYIDPWSIDRKTSNPKVIAKVEEMAERLRNEVWPGQIPFVLQAQTSSRPDSATVRQYRNLLQNIRNWPSDEARLDVQEAIMCYQAGIYRAAVVLSWTGVANMFQYLVVDQERSKYNVTAAKERWKTVKEIDDFWGVKDHEFLARLKTSRIISNDLKHALDECLHRRNSCAHGNLLRITCTMAINHLDLLLVNVFQRWCVIPWTKEGSNKMAISQEVSDLQ